MYMLVNQGLLTLQSSEISLFNCCCLLTKVYGYSAHRLEIRLEFADGGHMTTARQKTKYPGVYFREAKRIGGPGAERVYYVVYKKDGVTKEEKAGRQFADGMTEARANAYRSELIEGKRETRKAYKARLEAEKQAKALTPTMRMLWESYATANEKKRSLKDDKGRFFNHLAPQFGDRTFYQIDSEEVNDFATSLQDKKKLSDQTTRHVLALLVRLIRYGVTSKKMPAPDPNVLTIKLTEVDNEQTDLLDDDEYERLINAAANADNWKAGAVVLLALSTGMRKSEIFQLEWRRISLKTRFITLRAKDTKTRKRQQVYLNDFAFELLSRIPRTSPYVFPGETDDKPITNLYPYLRRIRAAAKLPNTMRPLHAWRHVFASRLVSDGESLYVIQRLLRHASIRMTERYAHLADKTLKRASEKAAEDLRLAQERGKQSAAESSPKEPKPE